MNPLNPTPLFDGIRDALPHDDSLITSPPNHRHLVHVVAGRCWRGW